MDLLHGFIEICLDATKSKNNLKRGFLKVAGFTTFQLLRTHTHSCFCCVKKDASRIIPLSHFHFCWYLLLMQPSFRFFSPFFTFILLALRCRCPFASKIPSMLQLLGFKIYFCRLALHLPKNPFTIDPVAKLFFVLIVTKPGILDFNP